MTAYMYRSVTPGCKCTVGKNTLTKKESALENASELWWAFRRSNLPSFLRRVSTTYDKINLNNLVISLNSQSAGAVSSKLHFKTHHSSIFLFPPCPDSYQSADFINLNNSYAHLSYHQYLKVTLSPPIMAPSRQSQVPPYAKDERVLCFHGDLMYEAKILEVSVKSGQKAEDAQYRIHYKGWKNTWDDWVSQDRIRKFTEDNKQLASQLQAQARMRTQGPKGVKKGGKANGSEMSSARGSEERAAGSSSFGGRGPRRGRDYELETEDAFHTRPSIKIIIPDVLKAILVDDWENVTKNNQLVPLPHPRPVTKILEDYHAYEVPKRPEGSSHVDILEETLAGLKEYFDKALGRILLYRFERAQYADMYKKWMSDDPEYQGKTASETYGAEHLMRLLVSMPELVAQTNMDQQSVNRLREELVKFCTWLSKNITEYFVSQYESPTQEYIQKAKE
ncbi:MRG-domain-containing protein [Hypoxylon trugodes]|uniref:MRG-domain-containing protein n=1 Tax=Hypoxylon trugodes TaxID=326681 RepID=UPI00219C10B8|nr:MRG-domain-containing protein [Hypoxylon trugodes]KAI1389033.1 MRG-domain-containing protein [Hypoxylon trugodes]